MTDLRLSRDLDFSLSVLYGENPASRQHHAEAHNFLLQMQSRNLRRKLFSLLQSQKDKSSRRALSVPSEVISMGSTWLACLRLLCSTAIDSSFRLFAAQTICHRVRRVRICEAVDLEMEQPYDMNQAEAVEWIRHLHEQPPTTQLAEAYVQWIPEVRIKSLVEHYWRNLRQNLPAAVDEDQIKGDLVLGTILGIMYITLEQHDRTDHNMRPLLQTLACTATTVAVRMIYGSTLQNAVGMVGFFQQVVSKLPQTPGFGDPHVLEHVLHECLAAIPDTVLASPGGRLSIDPSIVETVAKELGGQSFTLLWESIAPTQSLSLLLRTCERWAKFLTLPPSFVHESMPFVLRAVSSGDEHERRLAFNYLIAIAEGASWSLDQIVMLHLGKTDANHMVPSGKKKTGSRAMKRQQEKLESKISGSSDSELSGERRELFSRGLGCTLSLEAVWPVLRPFLAQAMHEAEALATVDGEGPLGYFTVAVNGCLQFLVKDRRWNDFAGAICLVFRDLCASKNSVVRGLCLEPLYTLHSATVASIKEQGSIEDGLCNTLVDHFFECGMRLAASCAYPPNYFDHMTAPSSEELEVERNDVRDLLRVVCGSDEREAATAALNITTLNKVLSACYDATSKAKNDNHLVHETVVHAFSSLAKPLYNAAWVASRLSERESRSCRASVELCASILLEQSNLFLERFQVDSVKELLPVVRLLHMGTASLAPFFDEALASGLLSLDPILTSSIKLSLVSLRHIPELLGPSFLESNPYDIRGTMRSPGGEDHVGALALVRLAFESDRLRAAFIVASQSIRPAFIELYSFLKEFELRRGRHISHGQGVGAKSRRMLLQLVCLLETDAIGDSSASSLLQSLVHEALRSVEILGSKTLRDENDYGRLADALLDFASFSSPILHTLLHDHTQWLQVATSMVSDGYARVWISAEAAMEWNRARGALYSLLASTGAVPLSVSASEALAKVVSEECKTTVACLSTGPSTASGLFVDDLISPDGVPAGIFLAALLSLEDQSAATGAQLLAHLRPTINSVILHQCSDPRTFIDPRPTIFEAWLLAVLQLSKYEAALQLEVLQETLVQTCSTGIILLLYPLIGRSYEERRQGPGMELDGPHILILMDFFASFFRLGPRFLSRLGSMLVNNLPVDETSLNGELAGPALVAAALFRAVQGALPPWAVESLPTVYEAFFIALDRNTTLFVEVFGVSLGLCLAANFGGVKAGQPVAGRLQVDSHESFLDRAAVLVTQNDIGSWRCLKVLVKQACGGKKKESDFRQKPALTSWNVMQAELPTY